MRQEYNKKILEILSSWIEKYPQLRFDQILWILGIEDGEDHFFRESSEAYTIVQSNLKS